MPDWDAERYHRLSGPQLAWGRQVLSRLAPRPGERILDLGCGTGRVTADIAATPGVRVVALDLSEAMLSEARTCVPGGVGLVRADGARLPFHGVFDAVFSGATFHWIQDHDRLFEEVHGALEPGGRIVAQCGGGPNLARLLERAHTLMDSEPFASHFGVWSDPWTFAGIEETRARLERAGFESIDVWLEEAPTTLPDARAFTDFISCVCVRHHVDTLPSALRPSFVAALARQAATDHPPFTLDYWRLNISARKARS